MAQFHIVLDQLINCSFMLVIGYLAIRLKIYDTHFLDGLSSIILKVLLPLLIFTNAVHGTTLNDLMESSEIMVLSVIMYLALMAVFRLSANFLRLTAERKRMFQACMVFGNAGFIGIALVINLFPDKGPIYVALMSIVDQFFLWTYGLALTIPKKESAAIPWKAFCNPVMLAILAALLFIIGRIPVPEDIFSPLKLLGSTAVPLSLVYLGSFFALCHWSPVLRDHELYVGILLKQVLFSLGFYAVLRYFHFRPDMVQTIVLISALPTMSTIAMFAEAHRNMADYAMGFVLVTTAASLFTISFVSYFIF